jgi:acetyltransferase-like isoleucine patch superfamily enzyme
MNESIDPKSLKKFRIIGDAISLELVEKVFNIPRYTVTIKLHGDDKDKYKEYFLTSDLLSNIDNMDSIKKIGCELIDEINAICNFVKNEFKPISFITIYVDQCGYDFFEEKISIGDALYIMEDGEMTDIDKPQILNIAAIIKNNILLKNILTILNKKGWDWVNLYRVLEMLKGAKIDVVKNEWISQKDYKNFTHTANSPKVLGEEARHGYQSSDPPKDPMPLAMAQHLISVIIWNYIRHCNENQNNGT